LTNRIRDGQASRQVYLQEQKLEDRLSGRNKQTDSK
jgi:hypothetical protein